MLNVNKLLRRQFVLYTRSKPQVSRFYNHTIVSPTTNKTDIQHVFEYNYECINRYAIVRIKL